MLGRMHSSLGTQTRAGPKIVSMYQRRINRWRVRLRPHSQTQLVAHPTIPPQQLLHKHQEKSAKKPQHPIHCVTFDVRAGVLHFRLYLGKPNLSAFPPSDFVSWVRGVRAADVPRPRNRMWVPLLHFHCFHVSPANTAVGWGRVAACRLIVVTKQTVDPSSSGRLRRGMQLNRGSIGDHG